MRDIPQAAYLSPAAAVKTSDPSVRQPAAEPRRHRRHAAKRGPNGFRVPHVWTGMNTASMATDVALAPSDDRASRLAALFDTHHPRLYRLARRLTTRPEDALDLVQDTFVRAARSPASIPTGASGEEAWLVRTLVNLRRDQWRRAAVRKRHDTERRPSGRARERPGGRPAGQGRGVACARRVDAAPPGRRRDARARGTACLRDCIDARDCVRHRSVAPGHGAPRPCPHTRTRVRRNR